MSLFTNELGSFQDFQQYILSSGQGSLKTSICGIAVYTVLSVVIAVIITNQDPMVEYQEEVLLNEDAWKTEAAGVIQDIQEHVQNICISENIQSSNQCIYLNVTTVEGIQYCIELSASGFRIVGYAYDHITRPSNQHFETPYALLNHISPSYSVSFGNLLLRKLEHVQTENTYSDPSV